MFHWEVQIAVQWGIHLQKMDWAGQWVHFLSQRRSVTSIRSDFCVTSLQFRWTYFSPTHSCPFSHTTNTNQVLTMDPVDIFNQNPQPGMQNWSYNNPSHSQSSYLPHMVCVQWWSFHALITFFVRMVQGYWCLLTIFWSQIGIPTTLEVLWYNLRMLACNTAWPY